MKKRKKKDRYQGLKVKQSQYRRAKRGGKTLDSLRQLRYNKAFRIPAPSWSQELLKAIEKEGEIKSQIETKPAKKAEMKDLLILVADLATGLWRIDKKTTIDNTNQTQDSMRSIRRHVESTLDALSSARVEIRDHIGEKYVTGMALKVIAFQPTSSVQVEKIAETIKPSVFYKNQLIQRGEVIVETPKVEQAELKSKVDLVEEVGLADEDEKHDRTENK